jgi:hypothetical protein
MALSSLGDLGTRDGIVEVKRFSISASRAGPLKSRRLPDYPQRSAAQRYIRQFSDK